ncbi:MAG: maltose alpha-D-glucosyltransferase, partial [Thermodesulfobacteriota bacterium]|nr:maltose alpha-D-glucosyltransferase [Thermodesulfobacteriota bacterium]
MVSRKKTLWYKDAIIYELHVKAFYDSNRDGIGDFRGLLEKLDYLEELGITAVWLLPFYPSPLRDDGYDIADYRGIHPHYGTLKDFKLFVREAHKRGIRVITELVVNHTSDQHPWFQAARRAKPGSARRNMYVWSDTDTKYPETRIIFTDTESSNWAWDPVAGAYYWHRFFSHQPDLNLNNPRMVQAVIKVLDFWLKMGVDGLRLDAVPYLCVREGSNNENLPETHQVIKRFRKYIDDHFHDRMLLAEANQWPEDVVEYFGDNDECHMAFHFPLMPRMFMALRQEDRTPIIEILNRTPTIPEECQWGLFLRNHDELTLEMVTDEERDYMYREYARDARMRLNLGIRRRLAPLVDNSLRRRELLHSLLFSLPGTPIIYYGDEIGMGDNIHLGDRNGVRTPMQWSADRNAGFSRADPAELYLPVIMDPVYGYQSVNVEAQQRNPSSFYHFIRRMIALRKQYKAFGRGTIHFLHPENRKVLAYLRRYKEEVILVTANLSRFVQPAELDLSEFNGWNPVEMLGRVEFPRIGELPYFITLGPHTFYWFRLEPQAEPIVVGVPYKAEDTSIPTLFLERDPGSVMEPEEQFRLETAVFPVYLPKQRYFRGKAREVVSCRIADSTKMGSNFFMTLVRVHYADGGHELYSVPLKVASGREAARIMENVPESVLALVKTAK